MPCLAVVSTLLCDYTTSFLSLLLLLSSIWVLISNLLVIMSSASRNILERALLGVCIHWAPFSDFHPGKNLALACFPPACVCPVFMVRVSLIQMSLILHPADAQSGRGPGARQDPQWVRSGLSRSTFLPAHPPPAPNPQTADVYL